MGEGGLLPPRTAPCPKIVNGQLPTSLVEVSYAMLWFYVKFPFSSGEDSTRGLRAAGKQLLRHMFKEWDIANVMSSFLFYSFP